MKPITLLAILLSLLLATQCVAQQQLAWPSNPQLGGFLPGHLGIPVVVDFNRGGERANWSSADLKLGDLVLLEMRNRPAHAFLQLFGHDVPNSNLSVPLEARVVKIDQGHVVVEFQITASRDSDAVKIIRVTSTLPFAQLVGPPTYSEPQTVVADEQSERIRETKLRQAKLPRVRIDSFDQTRIRTWTLATEISE